MSDTPVEEEETTYYRTSRQIFGEMFSSLGEALPAAAYLLFSPFAWMLKICRKLWQVLLLALALMLFKSWVLMLTLGMLHSWNIMPVSLNYRRSVLLTYMIYFLIVGVNFKSSTEEDL